MGSERHILTFHHLAAVKMSTPACRIRACITKYLNVCCSFSQYVCLVMKCCFLAATLALASLTPTVPDAAGKQTPARRMYIFDKYQHDTTENSYLDTTPNLVLFVRLHHSDFPLPTEVPLNAQGSLANIATSPLGMASVLLPVSIVGLIFGGCCSNVRQTSAIVILNERLMCDRSSR